MSLVLRAGCGMSAPKGGQDPVPQRAASTSGYGDKEDELLSWVDRARSSCGRKVLCLEEVTDTLEELISTRAQLSSGLCNKVVSVTSI